MKAKESIETERFYKIRVNKKNTSPNVTRGIAPIKEKKIKLNINKANNDRLMHVSKNKIINEKSESNIKNDLVTNQFVIDKMKLINNFNI